MSNLAEAFDPRTAWVSNDNHFWDLDIGNISVAMTEKVSDNIGELFAENIDRVPDEIGNYMFRMEII